MSNREAWIYHGLVITVTVIRWRYIRYRRQTERDP